MTTLIDILAIFGLAILAPIVALLEAVAKLLSLGATLFAALTERLA